jgi:hypothetical protein
MVVGGAVESKKRKRKDTRYLDIGSRKRAVSRYCMMKHRTKHTDTSRNKSYAGISVDVSLEDFVEWFMPKDFAGCSVDRVDKTKGYSLDNMQVVPLWFNIAKDKVKAVDGKTECYVCKITKPLPEFVQSRNRKLTGYSNICLECERTRDRSRSKRSSGK